MKVMKGGLGGILLIEPQRFKDERGFFLESYERERYEKAGIVEDFLQDNHSRSEKNVLRGLHFTQRNKQAQLLTVIRGHIFDVVVDVRKDSTTFGKWAGVELYDEGLNQIYMPHGFAHGFCVLSDYADLQYKVSQRYDPADDCGILWNDPTVNIKWPITSPVVSPKDAARSRFSCL